MPSAAECPLQPGQSALYLFEGKLNLASKEGERLGFFNIEVTFTDRDPKKLARIEIERVARLSGVPAEQIRSVIEANQFFVFPTIPKPEEELLTG